MLNSAAPEAGEVYYSFWKVLIVEIVSISLAVIPIVPIEGASNTYMKGFNSSPFSFILYFACAIMAFAFLCYIPALIRSLRNKPAFWVYEGYAYFYAFGIRRIHISEIKFVSDIDNGFVFLEKSSGKKVNLPVFLFRNSSLSAKNIKDALSSQS